VRVFILYILFTTSLKLTYSQVDYTRKHWVFGKNALLSFDENGITDVGTARMDGYNGSACYSNKAGELVLRTSGNEVIGKNNQLLSNLFSQGASDALIIPKNEEETQFYIFIIQNGNGLRTVDVDIEAKTVNLRPEIFNETGYAFKMAAVKHCFSDAYWLILPDNASTFYSFLVKPNSISDPVISTVASNRGNVGDFVSSHDGTMLALSSYLGDWAELYDFDKKCGTVSNPRDLRKVSDDDDAPHGISFSPDDQSVYVAWSYLKSNLYQYSLNNWGSISNTVQSQENINDVMLGLDGNLYLNVHENGNPSRRIHVVRNPNSQAGGGTRAIEDIVTLPLGTNGAFEFPSFISSHTGGGCGEVNDFELINIVENGNRCLNSPVLFNATIVENTYDSIRWDFDDPGSIDNITSATQVKKSFDTERVYQVRCFAFYCTFIDTFFFSIDMKKPTSFSLGNDSTLCFGDSMDIEISQPYDTFIWLDGDLKAKRTEKLGTFIAIVKNEACVIIDTITISQYPEIWTTLKQEYFICDLESETSLLDAGSGFKHYRWIPTGDTTQWIIVKDIGDYLVIVDSYLGCTGNGNTEVRRRCELSYHIPNAFTPNADNLNDVFRVSGEFIEDIELSIYNRWGQLIFVGHEWNGKGATSGVYFYKAVVKGFVSKLPVNQIESGIVHLIR
jgi:gliding motility-associated-like protein